MSALEDISAAAVIGLGLIGGSIGLALQRKAGIKVIGFDRSSESIEAAAEIGAINNRADSIADAVQDAELVFVATPVGNIVETVNEVSAAGVQGQIITDVGSVKKPIVEAIDKPNFIGGHPLAGLHLAGASVADEDLFFESIWFLTPTGTSSDLTVSVLTKVLEKIGAKPTIINPEVHDNWLASISHLTHITANALTTQAKSLAQTFEISRPVVGPSFRDATRVAGANSAIWTDIYLANRQPIINQIDQLIDELNIARRLLSDARPEDIKAWNDKANSDHNELTER